jgi:ABC-type transport system involved in cytochrome c biogenesis permease subunit
LLRFYFSGKKNKANARQQLEIHKTYNQLCLYPAILLLGAGIFLGAVWANISWGRYWGWDPKEVWALITFLIYSLPVHQRNLKFFSSSVAFHVFCLIAFLSVLITYFGVNYFLGGMHSYAQ